MEYLTRNRPKCMIPVHNVPMIIRLFNKFSDSEFIVITDYKRDVLKSYLQTFATVDYKIVESSEKGNIAGIADAAESSERNGSALLIWSDLVLSDEFDPSSLQNGSYVGISETFECSRSFLNNQFLHEKSKVNGVAGCFIIENMGFLKDIPREGSFVDWAEESGIEFRRMSMMGSYEIGTLKDFQALDDNNMRCRPYNHMVISKDYVIKSGLTEEGIKLIDREINWYKNMKEYGFISVPKIYEYSPMKMERIEGDNIFRSKLDDSQKRVVLEKIVSSLKIMHNYDSILADIESITKEYFEKTIRRLDSIKNAIPFSNDDYVMINGKKRVNVLKNQEILKKAIEGNIRVEVFRPIHGDCTLTNTLIDSNLNVYFIDARGYFGTHDVLGDPDYDWTKVYYSISGNFDQFNVKNFSLEINDDSVEYHIGSNGWEFLTEDFFNLAEISDVKSIRLIHSIIWLSLASHAWEDYDSMCLAYYNGLVLFDEFAD